MWAGYRSARVGCALPAAGVAGSKHTARALWTSLHGMQTLIALLVAAVAACAIARPPGPTAAPSSLLGQDPRRMRELPPPLQEYLGDYLLPRLLMPHYAGYKESPGLAPPVSDNDWLSKEIDRINQMDEDEELMSLYNTDILRWYLQNVRLRYLLDNPISIQEPVYARDSTRLSIDDDNIKPMSLVAPEPLPMVTKLRLETKRDPADLTSDSDTGLAHTSSEERNKFALTPMDEGYYEHVSKEQKQKTIEAHHIGHHEGAGLQAEMFLEPPRHIRQNPNLSKQKHLLEPDLGKLKSGLANKEYRLPVSLLPANLRWLKVSQLDNVEHHDDDDDQESSHEEGVLATQHQVHMLDAASDPAESFYGVALIAAVGAALAMAIVGFGFGWYTLSKRAKAAADVDYPAYGVTGPTVDSGDRKLAHSAHMYHYQHQKQQIIAMERNGLEQRTGSVSDPESEEENEEGDYTVYECPGFATTGDMEVKNPLFSEDPTPVTPGKCEVVKPQPKD